MYRKIDDFINDWKSEEKSTLKIFSIIHDKVLNEKPNKNIRSLGRLAWHITQSLTEMLFKVGLYEMDSLENLPVPNSFMEISDTYIYHSKKLIELLEKEWNDEDLFDTIKVYGQKLERRKILSSLVNHQIHHRAQMTILLRLMNYKVPGIYGPAKEEWAKFGIIPHE